MTSRPSVAIELRHLRYFLAVMEELHFGRAADRLHIAQPPLSQAIRKLENELGVQLLHRTSRVVTPTDAGRAFAEQAADVLASFDLAVAETRRAAGLGGILRIGSIPHLSLERLQAFLRGLSEREPSVHAHVTHIGSSEQTRRLRQDELDIGIFHHAGPLSELETEPLFPGETLGAFLPTTHPLAAKPALGAEDLRDEVLVTYPREGNPALYDRMLSILGDAGFRFAGFPEASSMSPGDLMLAVADGLGVAVGPVSPISLSEGGMLVSCCQLDPPVSMPDIVLAWPRHPPRDLRAVLGSVREIARELREGSSVEKAHANSETNAAESKSR
jgi:DNA-binding transcriptional LysR family regulator